MIFFIGNDGTVINSVPSPVYQGSAGANDIYVVAPFAANLSATVAFKLPNGVWTERYLMTPVNEISGIVNDKTGKTYSGWQFSMPNSITEYYGTVTAQFFFYSAQTEIEVEKIKSSSCGVITATSSTSFTVGRGVPSILPDAPAQDVYETIQRIISSIQSDLKNGYFTARAIYAWNSEYAYGANELVFYPDKGEYGVFLKSLTADNTEQPYTNGILNDQYWQLISDFNILAELYTLKNDVQAAVQKTQAQAEAAAQSASNALNSQNSAEQSATNAEESARRIEAAAEYLDGVQDGTIVVPKAAEDEAGNNIVEHFETIESYIPSGTSEENQLADKAFVNSSINAMAAFYITSNEQGDAFPTREDLLNTTTFYSGGQEREPTQNDYAYVLADESQPKDSLGNYPTTRYSYQGGTYPNGQWDFQYIVNNTSLTQAQVDAINSGITKELVDQLSKGSVIGVKGNTESEYRTGNVNLTPENIGSVNKSGDTMIGNLNVPNVAFPNDLPNNDEPEYFCTFIDNDAVNGLAFSRTNEMPFVKKSGDTMTGKLTLPSIETTGEDQPVHFVTATGSEDNRYFYIGNLPQSSDFTFASIYISGTIGGWQSNSKDTLNITIGNRDGLLMSGYGTGYSTSYELVGYRQSDNSINIYLHLIDSYTAIDIFCSTNQGKLARYVSFVNPTGTQVNIQDTIIDLSKVYSPSNPPSSITNSGESGAITFAGGFKIVWGQATIPNGTYGINFPYTFSQLYTVVYSRKLGTMDWDKSIITSQNNSGFTIRNDGYGFIAQYIAIGKD